jgi:hypothetical protein
MKVFSGKKQKFLPRGYSFQVLDFQDFIYLMEHISVYIRATNVKHIPYLPENKM